MEPVTSTKSVNDDVLHFENQKKLTPEEIAKAIAHHDRHHGGGKGQEASAQKAAGKNSPNRKMK